MTTGLRFPFLPILLRSSTWPLIFTFWILWKTFIIRLFNSCSSSQRVSCSPYNTSLRESFSGLGLLKSLFWSCRIWCFSSLLFFSSVSICVERWFISNVIEFCVDDKMSSCCVDSNFRLVVMFFTSCCINCRNSSLRLSRISEIIGFLFCSSFWSSRTNFS